MFFSYFLAQVFRETLLRDASAVRVLLSRSVLPQEVASSAVAGLDRETSLFEQTRAQWFLDRLAQAAQVETPRSSQVRENAGLVAATVLKQAANHGELRGLTVAGVVIPGGDLEGVDLRDGRFERVEFRRVDLTRTRLLNCHARGVLLSEVVVNPHYTRLELDGVEPASQILGIRVREAGLARGVYDPNEVRQILVQCGAATAPSEASASTVRNIPERFERLLERLARSYRRMNPVCTSDDTLRSLFQDGSWPALEAALVRHGVVTREHRATKGQQKLFLRRQFLPDALMAGADRAAEVAPQIRAFWDDIEGPPN
ncbi:MAG: pentapeptide repeat-containing protein [Acidobacteria bacterium]|nr:pentapeptide repeat-containing protein [Acidobacteriota bacterium]